MGEEYEAGRSLDILIAEQIFGMNRLAARLDPMNRNGEPQFFWGYPLGHDFAPPYSTDMGAAWSVMEKMRQRFGVVNLYGQDTGFGDRTNPHFFSFSIGPDFKSDGYASATTAPLAICLAALKALAAVAAEKEESQQ